jgi:hypothetical protein
VGARQGLEVRRPGAQLAQQVLGLLARLRALGGRLVGLGDDQDVVRAALLGAGPAARVLVVVALQVGLGDLDVASERVQAELDELDARLLGRPEARLVGLVEGLELGVGGLHLAAEGGGVEALHLHLAPLQQGVERHRGHLLGRHHAGGDATEHLLHAELGAQPLGEHLRAHALRGQDVPVDAAVGVAQAGELRVGGEQPLQPPVGREQVARVGLGQQHALAHDRLQRLAPDFGRVEQRDVQARHLLAHALDRTLVRQVPLGPGDLEAVDLGHRGVRRVGHVGVALHAEEDERGDDQQHHQTEHQPGMRTDEFEHRGGLGRSGEEPRGNAARGGAVRAKRRRRTAVRLPGSAQRRAAGRRRMRRRSALASAGV